MGAAKKKVKLVLPDEEKSEKEPKVASQLPTPTGYHMLIALPEVEEKTSGGIYKPDSTLDVERYSTVTGMVLSMGPDCYKDESKFPTGPWCSEGDWVVFRAFQGTRVKIHGKEFRILNDDSIEAVVEDPTGIVRAG